MRTSTRAVVSVLALGLALATPVAATAQPARPVGAPAVAPAPDPAAPPAGTPEPTATPEATPTPDPADSDPDATPTPDPTDPADPADPADPDATPTPEPSADPVDPAWSTLPLAAALPGPMSPMPAPAVIDSYASYDPQVICDPTPKPGTVYLQDLALSYFGAGRRSGISRACNVGGTSEHKEGRAFDWGLSVYNPVEFAAGNAFVDWLIEVGPDGKVGYNARRLGVMYIIWNGLIWYNSGPTAAWRPYGGSNPHTDHVHVSMTWDGALRRTSWWTGVAAPPRTTTTVFVTQVYEDLFGRTPDTAGLTGWSDALKRGTPRVEVANAITGSREYRSSLIAGAYDEFLGRPADAPGLEGWLGAMSRGLTIQELEGGFVASPEYYSLAGGTDDGWVRQLYRHVLGREAAESEVQSWSAALRAGASRTSVARGFLISAERLGTVIDGYYVQLLGRPIDATGRQGWVAAVQSGVRTEQIIGGIVASEEYYARAQQLASH